MNLVKSTIEVALMEARSVTSQELQERVLQLPLQERWQLVQDVLTSIQRETLSAEELAFPHIDYQTGRSGLASPVIQGTGVRVQALAIAAARWNWKPSRIAEEYDLSEAQVLAALTFYRLHKGEIDRAIASEVALETANV